MIWRDLKSDIGTWFTIFMMFGFPLLVVIALIWWVNPISAFERIGAMIFGVILYSVLVSFIVQLVD